MSLEATKRQTALAQSLLVQHRTLGRHEYVLSMRETKRTKHTAAGIPTWSPTVVLICRSTAYVWQSGRDAQFSADCGRMYQ